MSHGVDGNAGHGSSDHGSRDHGPGNHSMHSLGNHNGHHSGTHGFVPGTGHHAGSAMHAALGSSSHAASTYGAHSVAMVFGGMAFGGHVINMVSNFGPANHDAAGHVDGPGANRQSPRDLRIKDIKGAKLLVAHAVGLVDHGSGFYDALLDSKALELGLMRIDSRPNLKGEDSLNLDGILPWNAWGNPNSRTGPDGYEPLLRGTTDRIIHIFAIPTWDRKKKKMHVSPDETITLTVRMTVWHYAQTADAEVKIEFIVNSPYVFDRLQCGRYTSHGKRTERLEEIDLKLAKELFAALTAVSEHADPARREKYVRLVNQMPDRKGRKTVSNTHPAGVHVGTEAEREELENEEVAEVKKEDRDSENQVAGATVPGVSTTPTVTSDDDSDLTGPNGSPGAVVWGPPTPPTPPTPTPTPMPDPAKPSSGTLVIPVDLK